MTFIFDSIIISTGHGLTLIIQMTFMFDSNIKSTGHGFTLIIQMTFMFDSSITFIMRYMTFSGLLAVLLDSLEIHFESRIHINPRRKYENINYTEHCTFNI